jgi:hypothetical protein
MVLQRQNPHIPPHALWPRFLAAIKDDPEMYEAALQKIERPQPPKPSPGKDRAFRERLLAAADKAGIMVKEREVRRLLSADKTAKASALRNETMAEMRRLAGRITQELSAVSS